MKEKEIFKNKENLTRILRNEKIIKIEQFKLNELVIFCEKHRFFINVKKNGNLDFSVTEN